MKSIYHGLVVLAVLTGCRHNEYPPVFMGKNPILVEFEDTHQLEGEPIHLEVLGATNIYLLDTLMLFTTPQLETLYHAVSTRDLRWQKSFIGKGEGPNELSGPLQPLSFENAGQNHLISFYDKSRQGLFHYNLQSLLQRGEDRFQDTIPVEGLTEIYTAYKINEEEIFVDNLDFINLNQQYSIYRWKEKQILRTDTAIVSGLTNHGDVFLMATITAFNKRALRYAGAMMFMDQLNIYDIANPEKSIALSVRKNPTSLNEASRALMPLKKEYYVDLREANGRLFGLYANQSRKEWATGDKPAEIHVINWDGKPICKLATREKLLHFDIDPATNVLYGLTEKQEMIKYDLNEIPELAGQL